MKFIFHTSKPFEVCFICHKVRECHTLFQDGDQKIKVCAICDFE